MSLHARLEQRSLVLTADDERCLAIPLDQGGSHRIVAPDAATISRLPVVLERTQQIVDHVENIAAAEISVPPALRDGNAVTADVREIVAGARAAWPVRNLVDVPAPTQFKADSDPRAQGGHAAQALVEVNPTQGTVR